MSWELGTEPIWIKACEGLSVRQLEDATRLKVEFNKAHRKVDLLADSYKKYNEGYTDHTIKHFDALWKIAEKVLPDDHDLSVLEVFVLGLTFLTHDLGMGIATYNGGEDEIRGHKLYKDLYKRAEGNLGGNESVDETQIIGDFLRINHARKAETLLTEPFLSNGKELYILEDQELRELLGEVEGKIAASHHWPIEKVMEDLPDDSTETLPLGSELKLRPKFLAGILRVCDACHISGDRTPDFARLGRAIDGVSKNHWDFHSLIKPIQRYKAGLRFSSKKKFTQAQTDEWWLAHDAICVADRELASVRRMNEECGYPEFFSDGIDGAQMPTTLAKYIQCDGWEPADVRLQVSDVTHIVEVLGGKKLYGDNETVPLRELIQNARDAVKAREALGTPADYRGRIDVRLVEDGDDLWLEVEDNGIGMTPEVITGPLLDFGKSYWRSRDILFDLEGLASTDFEAAGRFGIGFFSVFMLGDHVQVISNRKGRNEADTRVLEFKGGTGQRPVLRHLKDGEKALSGGTRVRVKLRNPRFERATRVERPQVMELRGGIGPANLEHYCEEYCLAIDVDLYVTIGNESPQILIWAEQWREQLHHASDWFEYWEQRRKILPVGYASENYRLWYGTDDRLLGKVVCTDFVIGFFESTASLVSGGLKVGVIYGLEGVLMADPVTVTRDKAWPIATENEFKSLVRDNLSAYLKSLGTNSLGQVDWRRFENTAFSTEKLILLADWCGEPLDSLPISFLDGITTLSSLCDLFVGDDLFLVLYAGFEWDGGLSQLEELGSLIPIPLSGQNHSSHLTKLALDRIGLSSFRIDDDIMIDIIIRFLVHKFNCPDELVEIGRGQEVVEKAGAWFIDEHIASGRMIYEYCYSITIPEKYRKAP